MPSSAFLAPGLEIGKIVPSYLDIYVVTCACVFYKKGYNLQVVIYISINWFEILIPSSKSLTLSASQAGTLYCYRTLYFPVIDVQ